MNIIVSKKGTEALRKQREAAEAIRRHYYDREQRDGSRFRSKAGTKAQIRKVYE
jgi:hypothetical protein